MPRSHQLVCVGDTTLDTFLKIHDATVHCNLKTEDCELCFRYGEKIPVDQLEQNPGGNAANVAAGTAKLGVKTALYAMVGEDDIGFKVRAMLHQRGVNTSYLQASRGQKTNYSTILSFRKERTILEIKYPARLTFGKFPKADWVYLSSIKQEPKSIYSPLVKLKKRQGFKIAFNPGMYQLAHPSNDILKFLPNVDVLILNKEEAVLISSKSKVQSSNQVQNLKSKMNKNLIQNTLYIIQSITRGFIFVTDGERGAWGYDGKQMVHCKKFPAHNIVDRTGAGDAFASGLVSGLIRGEKYPDVIRWGMANSAAVLSEIGPQNGVLNLREMKLVLQKTQIEPREMRGGRGLPR